MTDIKFGLKLWSKNYSLIGEAETLVKTGFFQYIELMVVPDTDIRPFQNKTLPFILHATSENWGFNIADQSKTDFNSKVLANCFDWARKLDAPYIVLHPGFCDFNAAKKFLANIDDRRIAIENMPVVGENGEKMVGATVNQAKELMADKFGFCLDIGHVIKASASLKKDWRRAAAGWARLKPAIIHICDGRLASEQDEHLNIGSGDFDFNFIASLIERSGAKFLSLETPRNDLGSLREDLDNLAKLKTFFGKKTFCK